MIFFSLCSTTIVSLMEKKILDVFSFPYYVHGPKKPIWIYGFRSNPSKNVEFDLFLPIFVKIYNLNAFLSSTLCDPYLNIFRGVIPPLGGTLDLSPILAFLVLNAFTSTAAALPAELPPTGVPQQIPSSHTRLFDLTTAQKKWVRRLHGNRSKSSCNVK